MSSAAERRAEASRENSLRSTGPRTPTGQATSALNSVKHGLCSSRILPGENRAEFLALRDALLARYPPADPVEEEHLAALAIALWKRRRGAVLSAALLEAYGEKVGEAIASGDDSALREDALGPALDRLGRHEVRIDRQVEKGFEAVEAYRAARAEASSTEFRRDIERMFAEGWAGLRA